ncbi:cytochrome c oxidase accessory protein CcoG [Salinarimonas ramus]|uniref:Cytochrome c oxidase accessory protein CcoG n=1 Tax=Salinarimonas ramus TaxID=690164 RepID=A0A917QJ25_9HYPH|nr:cytochrome c oxidase accessory protein CcoG [Salinarimonas ramus]GGK51476.1 cytochrome c oxidase accessory protein CcoG [Salinarimonas ramus]
MVALDVSHATRAARLGKPKAEAMRGRVTPQAVSGHFRRIKWGVLAACLGLYYALPLLRWDRGPGQPDQAVLVDLAHVRAYLFGLELWPSDVILVTGLLVLATLVLVLVNALAGRVWCGFLCPQTVWTDLFLLIERRIEGDRRERLRKREGPLTLRRSAEIGVKHALWLLVAVMTGGAFALYFADAPTLLRDLATGAAPAAAYGAVAALTLTTYLLAGHAREQVCTWMCPWPRLQNAIFDPKALSVAYRDARGEPRLPAKRALESRARGEPAGDCVDCAQCVAVCPIGIDIREGPSFACINCGLCVDACDSVMARLSRPHGLIAYAPWEAIEAERAGTPAPRWRALRPKTLALAAGILVIAGAMITTLALRTDLAITSVHDRNPAAVLLSDGRVRNGYAVTVANRSLQERTLVLSIEGLADAEVSVVGADPHGRIVLEAGARRPLRVLVNSGAQENRDVAIVAADVVTGATRRTADVFVLPAR